MAPKRARLTAAEVAERRGDAWWKKERKHAACVERTMKMDETVRKLRRKLREAKVMVEELCDKEGEAKVAGLEHSAVMFCILIWSFQKSKYSKQSKYVHVQRRQGLAQL